MNKQTGWDWNRRVLNGRVLTARMTLTVTRVKELPLYPTRENNWKRARLWLCPHMSKSNEEAVWKALASKTVINPSNRMRWLRQRSTNIHDGVSRELSMSQVQNLKVIWHKLVLRNKVATTTKQDGDLRLLWEPVILCALLGLIPLSGRASTYEKGFLAMVCWSRGDQLCDISVASKVWVKTDDPFSRRFQEKYHLMG